MENPTPQESQSQPPSATTSPFPLLGTTKGPINIALIKYWGKQNESLIYPLNNSISLTWDMSHFYTETTIIISPAPAAQPTDTITLTINGSHSPVTSRIQAIITKFKSLSALLTSTRNQNTSFVFEISSRNTFPTASGCASSASSMACLVTCLNNVLKLNLSKQELSSIARLGSGSACRSVFGGIVEWNKFDTAFNDSFARQWYDENYWNWSVMLIIVTTVGKDISSSWGMKLTKETSELFKYRIDTVVDKHIKEIKTSWSWKDFPAFGKVMMQDSNNFHACCRDTFPTIAYWNEWSEYIIKCVECINRVVGKIVCAYTFDAGANAFIVFEEGNEKKIEKYFDVLLYDEESELKEFEEMIKKRPYKGVKDPRELFVEKMRFKLGKGAE